MKKIILLTIFALFVTTYSFARRGIPIPVCMPCEKLEEVKDLPNDETLLVSGSHLNLGYIYEQYGAIFVPVWNTSGRFVLINESKTTYYDLTDEQLTEYQKAYDLDITSNPISFWGKIGGKLIVLLLVVIIVYLQFSKDPDEEEEEKPTSL